jgi:hypothetical protein
MRDLSTTLQAILGDPSLAVPYPELSRAQITLDRPDDGFKPAQTTDLANGPRFMQDQAMHRRR